MGYSIEDFRDRAYLGAGGHPWEPESSPSVLKATVAILTSFAIEDEDRHEVRADLQHLRRWRKSVEQAQSYTVKAVITIIVTGVVGAMWLGIKALLGK
jgi:hypothetical protein